MIDDSYLVFEDHSIINFTKNSAEKGGAMVRSHNGLSKSACFYQIITCIQNHRKYISLTTKQKQEQFYLVVKFIVICLIYQWYQVEKYLRKYLTIQQSDWSLSNIIRTYSCLLL